MTDKEPQQLVKDITDDVRRIVQGEIELAKSEIMPAAKAGGVGAGMFGAAGYVALNGLSLLFIAAALGIAVLIKHWWPLGFAIMGVALLLIAGILALIGKGQLSKAKQAKPTQAIEQAQLAQQELTATIKTANEQAKGPLPVEGGASTSELPASAR